MVSGRLKNIEKQRNHVYEKDKRSACREEEVGECPDCSFEDEIFQVAFFTIVSNGIDTV